MKDMTPQEKLAACPFCGNGNTLMVEHVEGTVLHPAYYVRCDNCGAIGPTTDNGGHADLWNSRPATLLSEHGGGGEAGDESIMCEVAVAPATRFSPGVALSTVVDAIKSRRGTERYTFNAKMDRITTPPTPSAPVGLGVVDELLTNIKRSCVRGRNAADPTPENSSFIATFDHIEDLAQQAKRALTPPTTASREETKCVRCGEPTMHLGNVCYACSHPAAAPTQEKGNG